MSDPYEIPLEDNSVDVCVSSSCFEHSEFFWLLFLDSLRVLKPAGLLYLNVPSNGMFHRYPVDCWRFYPDSGRALQNWGTRNGDRCVLLESFIAPQQQHGWNDFVAVFLKDEQFAASHPRRMHRTIDGRTNCISYGGADMTHQSQFPQDQLAHIKLKRVIEAFRIVSSQG